MPISKAKKESMVKKKRAIKVASRSLDGRGYFMDAHDDSVARKYIETGEEGLLESLPDYRRYSGT